MQEEHTGPSEGSSADQPTETPATDRIVLTPVQEEALQQLATGKSIAGAATSVGVNRRTVFRWLQSDPNFAAAYNAWRRETIASGRARVLAMTDIALDTMRSAMQQGNARVAVQVAKAAGALDAQTPGPADPHYLERRRELHAEKRALALEAAEKQLKTARGEDPEAWQQNAQQLEGIIERLLDLRRKALEIETPEARNRRLDEYEYLRRSRSIEFVRLMELSDAAIAAEATGSDKAPAYRHIPDGSVFYSALYAACAAGSPVKVGADERNVLEIAPNTPPDALPAAPPLTAPRSPDRPADPPPPPASPAPRVKSLPAPLPPPASRPLLLGVAYDGSDNDDNDPNWTRIA